MADYNGWANHATWNVALWLNNDEGLYRLAREYARRARNVRYEDFVNQYLVEDSYATPDGVAWLGDELDYDALDEMLVELGE